MTLYLKALRAGRLGTHTEFVWPLDEWVHVEGELRACHHGLHVCRPDQIVEWLDEELWLVEADDRYKPVDADDKMVVRRARLVRRLTAWDERTARLFAADCAERVLHLFEQERPGDDRPRRAIEVARQYACGEVDDAARDAAWDAARDAAWDAARDAAGAAAWAAAWAAARDAAGAAAGAAARDAWAAAGAAAWDAERQWQTDQLLRLLDLTADERRQLGGAS